MCQALERRHNLLVISVLFRHALLALRLKGLQTARNAQEASGKMQCSEKPSGMPFGTPGADASIRYAANLSGRCSCLSPLRRQDEIELAAFPRFTFHADMATVRDRNLTSDREPQPCATFV